MTDEEKQIAEAVQRGLAWFEANLDAGWKARLRAGATEFNIDVADRCPLSLATGMGYYAASKKVGLETTEKRSALGFTTYILGHPEFFNTEWKRVVAAKVDHDRFEAICLLGDSELVALVTPA